MMINAIIIYCRATLPTVPCVTLDLVSSLDVESLEMTPTVTVCLSG